MCHQQRGTVDPRAVSAATISQSPSSAQRGSYDVAVADQDSAKRASSDILDAIFDKVAQRPERPEAAGTLFRPKALARLDLADEVDNQLPLVSRRSWLLLVGLAALLGAVILWMALTPSVTSVTAMGRVVASPGVISVGASAPGTLTSVTTDQGAVVEAGDVLAVVTTATGDIEIVAPSDGTVWQLLVVSGEVVESGATIATVLPDNSDFTVLLALPEDEATDVSIGMSSTLSAGQQTTGTVTAVATPAPAADVAQRLGVSLPFGQLAVLVTVTTDSPLIAGTLTRGQVILTDETVLRRLLGGS